MSEPPTRKNERPLSQTPSPNEERLRLALEAARIGIWEVDVRTGAVRASDVTKALLALPPGAVLSHRNAWRQQVHTEDREWVEARFQAALRGEADYDVEYRVCEPDGRVRWIASKGKVLRDEAGQPVSVIGVASDVTERQAAEAERAHMAAIVESSDDAILSKTLDGIITSWNTGAVRLYGYTAEEVIGRSVSLLAPPEHPDEIPQIMERLRRGERIDHYETVRVRKDGKRLHVSVTISPVRDRMDRIIGASAIARDITKRRQTEEALRRTTEQLQIVTQVMSVPVTRCSRDLKYLWVSQPYAGWMARPADEIIGRPIIDVIGHEAFEQLRPHFERVLSGQVVRYEEQVRFQGIGLRWINAVYTPTLDVQGVPDGWVAVVIDVDERKRMEETLKQANTAKDNFLATVSHELRTPLTSILGWARMLRATELDESTTARALESIERNAKAQAQLVEDLLDVSRIISGRMRLTTRAVDLAPVIEAAVEAAFPAAQAKGIRIQRMLDSAAGPVFGDPDRLQQIVWNLLSNAIKFTGKGGRVQVRLERINSHVEISVSDTGVGIRPEVLPHIFERFLQADSSTTRKHGGIGLGLAIVRHLVELHGGTVEAESPGEWQGATFRVRLPIMVVHTAGEIQSAPHTVSAAVGAIAFDALPRLDDVDVLVVDDEPDTRELLTTVLERCGARVMAVGSAAEALDVLPGLQPDVLVSDIGMPEEDGYALIAKVRMLPPDQGGRVPAVALTAHARVEDRLRALSAGYQMHVAKPVDPTELVTILASLLGRNGPSRREGKGELGRS